MAISLCLLYTATTGCRVSAVLGLDRDVASRRMSVCEGINFNWDKLCRFSDVVRH